MNRAFSQTSFMTRILKKCTTLWWNNCATLYIIECFIIEKLFGVSVRGIMTSWIRPIELCTWPRNTHFNDALETRSKYTRNCCNRSGTIAASREPLRALRFHFSARVHFVSPFYFHEPSCVAFIISWSFNEHSMKTKISLLSLLFSQALFPSLFFFFFFVHVLNEISLLWDKNLLQIKKITLQSIILNKREVIHKY